MSFDILNHQRRLAMALLDTEIQGIKIDIPLCTQLGVDLQTEIVNFTKSAALAAAGEIKLLELEQWSTAINKFKTEAKRRSVPKPEFNWGSSTQLGQLLYEKLKLPGKKKKPTATGKENWDTSRPYLEEIQHLHPVVSNIVEINRLQTYYATFIQGMLEREISGRIYPEFKVNGTDTGRISHVNPNMGNLPSRHPVWNRIRNIFLPNDDETLAKADYSQLEVCIAAHYSHDANLLRIVHEGASQHDITAEGLGVSRTIAKTINFAMQYGATEYKIKQILNCSLEDAKLVLNKYWETYKGMKRKIDEVHSIVERGGTLVSIFNRGRRFPRAKNKYELSSMKRQGWSFIVQGTGGDCMNRAFYLTAEELKRKQLGRAGWTVHDEGIIFPKKEHDKEAYQVLEYNMINVGKEIGLTVPLRVEGESGLPCWRK